MTKLQIQVLAVIVAALGIADEWLGTGIIGKVGQEVVETIVLAVLTALPFVKLF